MAVTDVMGHSVSCLPELIAQRQRDYVTSVADALKAAGVVVVLRYEEPGVEYAHFLRTMVGPFTVDLGYVEPGEWFSLVHFTTGPGIERLCRVLADGIEPDPDVVVRAVRALRADVSAESAVW